jgi:hypothetical protein
MMHPNHSCLEKNAITPYNLNYYKFPSYPKRSEFKISMVQRHLYVIQWVLWGDEIIVQNLLIQFFVLI